jgi:hypothetical protein
MTYEGPNRRIRPGKDMEPVFLTRKLAEALNGIMLAGFEVGDRICLDRDKAELLIAEGWAAPAPPGQRRQSEC